MTSASATSSATSDLPALPAIHCRPPEDFSAWLAAEKMSGKLPKKAPGKTAPRHLLIVIPPADALPADLPARTQWLAVLRRKAMQPGELAKTPLAIDLADGRRLALLMDDTARTRFERLTRLRQAAMLLLDEMPTTLAIHAADAETARDALFAVLVNAVPLPTHKKKPPARLAEIVLCGPLTQADLAPIIALARANGLCRQLTASAPNVLTPASYRQRIRQLAKAQGLRIEEYDFKRLRKMGAGAFCAVAQGSPGQDEQDGAAIVHLSYRPAGKTKANAKAKKLRRVALVGKGICFDTGGHNLKPARYMAGMQKDMNGSAVALALTLAAAEMRLPVALDCWLAIAQNHLSPTAYTQDEIVTALDGTTIEIVHTDAEGRMVLADALTLATRDAPDLVVDFATLTGSMHAALGERYSGVFASSEALVALAVAAGKASGERLCAFPLDEDYAAALESKVADIKQCTLDGGADHILAALFLQRFTHRRPWLHLDLASARCAGGLGVAASEMTGFGVAWGMRLLRDWLVAQR